MRLIDADALIEGYKHMGYDPKEYHGGSYMEGWCKGFNSAVDHCIHHAIHAPTVLAEPQWIACSERLPEEKDAGILKKLGINKRSDYVLATVEVKNERMTVTACTYDGVWYWKMKYAFPDYEVVAWMPLPELYKENSNG